jgi:hypothetical protein
MTQRERLSRILNRFVREEDSVLEDDAFILVVMERYRAEREAPIVDVNE